MTNPHILSLSKDELSSYIAAWQQPRFRAKQIAEWVYTKGVIDPHEMTNLPKSLRDQMLSHLDWRLPEITSRLDAEDGSSKLLLRNQRGQLIEAVILRYENRTSLCISSQVGCKLACSFCQTGKLGFVSHLSQAEILGQLMLANRILRDEDKRVSHVVFMGMGEPLDNYKNTVGAANRMIDPEYFGLSARHVTLSTSGLAPQIEQLANESRAALALSLHAARDDLRTELMPINRKYPLERLKQALVYYQKTTGRKITIEYIMIRNANCSRREAKDLVRFLHGLRCKVNLIPFNSHPGLPHDRPTAEDIRAFQKYLAERSIPAPVRYSKGLDVSAACGQLAAKNRDDLNAQPVRRNLVVSSP
jgi:23S rRNA (adenine2503-C2)-methyltransferase